MATFIPTSNSRVGKTGYTGFTPTKNAGYKQSTLFGWQQQNKAALDILNRYNEIIKSGGWMSTDDRARYKAALDSYTYSSKALRDASEFYGATYTPEERNSWKNSLSQMNNDYNSMNDFYNQFGDETSYGYYSKRWSNDFEENSKYVSTRYGDPHLNVWSGTYDDTGFSDIEYDYINKNTVASDIKLNDNVQYGSTLAGTDNTERLQMTDDEIKTFNYIYKTEGKDKAYEYVSYLESDLNARQRQATQEAWAKYAEEKPFEASAFSILTSPIKGISYIGQTADFIDDGKIDQNAGYNKYSHINSAIRNQVTQNIAATKWGEIGSFAYQTGMSMGDFLFNTAITGGNQALSLALMGTSAAADTTIAAKDRGLEDWQAFTLGTVAGAAEIVTEKIGLDALFDTALLGKNALGYVIKNALAEGGEEVGSSVINLLTDTIVSGDKSYWKTAINSYMSRGADEKTAFWRAVGDQALSLGADFLGGAISGGVMGGVGAGIHSAGVAIEGSKIKNGSISNPSLLTDVALSYDTSNIYAQKMQDKVAKGGELSNYQVGKLAGQIQSGIIEQDTSKIRSAAESRLAELGETGDISAIADALTKQVKGEELSRADRKVLDESKALEERSNGKIVRTSTVAERVANELKRENILSGQYSSAWAEGIGTKLVNSDVYNRRESNNTPARENTTGATSSTTSDSPSPRGRKIAANVLVRNAEGKAVRAEIQGVEVEGDKATFTLSNGEKVSEDKVTFRTEREALVAKLATTKVSRVQGFSTEAATAMIKGYDGNTSPTQYDKVFTEAFKAGKEGASTSMVRQIASQNNVSEPVVFAAYDIGREFSNSVLKSSSKSGTINIENTEATNESRQSIPVRESSKWLAGANPEGQVSRMEGSTGQIESRSEVRRYADSEVAGIADKGREVRVSDLGILGGSEHQKVRILDNVEETADMKEGREYAESRGLKVRYYAGDALTIETKRGTIDKVNAYILGNNIIVRATSPDFTSKQFVRHEVGHDMIAKGEVNIDEVRAKVKETFKSNEEVDQVAKYYEEAYSGSGLNADEIWEEVICDSLGDMNIFAKSNNWAEAAVHVGMTIPAIQQAVAETKVEGTQQTRGSPDSTAVYNTRDGSNGWGGVYGTAQEALNDAIARVDSNLSSAFTEEISTEKEHYAISDAIIAVQEDVRQDTITPIQGAKLLSEVYQRGGAEALDRLYNHETGNLHPKALERAMQYSTSAGEVTEGKASRDLYTLTNEYIREVTPDDRRRFNRSLADLTATMRDGEVRTFYIWATENVYVFRADGYMHGEMIRSYNGNDPQALEDFNNEYDRIDQDAETSAIWTEASENWKDQQRIDSVLYEGRRRPTSNDTLSAGASKSDRTGDTEREWTNPRTEEEIHEIVNKVREMYGLETVDYSKQGKFSRELDVEYLSAVNRGDMETAQRMVDEAAKKAGYDSPKLYHGTNRGGFTIFDDTKNDLAQKGFFFTTSPEVAKSYFKSENGTLYTEYTRMIKPLIIEGHRRSWDNLQFDIGNEAKAYKAVQRPDGWWTIQTIEGRVSIDGVVAWKNEEQAIQAYKNAPWTHPTRSVLNTTRQIVRYAYNKGEYDGVIIKNTIDMGNSAAKRRISTLYIPFSPEQIKSADPVTYDDNGDVIPLSERFNPEEKDIRYSREPDLIDYIGEKADGKEYKPLTNRELLANALETTINNEAEQEKITEYKSKIDELNKQSLKAFELRKEIKEISFSKGKRDSEKLKSLKEELRKTENRINYYDRKLLQLESTKALKDVVERARSDAYKKAAEKGRENLHRNVEGRHKSEARAKIKALKHNFEHMIEHPTDRQYVPKGLISAMVDVCDMIDTSSPLYKADGSINKAQLARNETRDRLIKLSDEYKKIKNDPDAMISQEYDEEISDYLDEIRQNYEGKNVSDMTLEELTELYRTMRSIDETLRDARKLIGWSDAESVYDAGDSIISEQNKIAESRKNGKRSVAQKVDDGIANLSLSPMRATLKMAGYNEASSLYQLMRDVEKGVRSKQKFVMDANKSFEKLTTGDNAKKYEDAIYQPYGKELVDKNGNKFSVSKMQMMQAVMSYDREIANDKLHHVSKGGFTFADLKLLSKGKLREAISAENAHTVTLGAELAVKFKTELAKDKWAQEYIATAKHFFDETAKNAVNETNLKLKHRIVATGNDYIPYEVNKDYVVREITSENDIQQVISSYGMLKDIKAGATQPLIITGLNNVLDRHIEQVGNIQGLAIPIRNFNKVWNVKASDGSTTVQEMIGKNWGDGGKKVITQAIKDVQGSRISNQSDLYKKIKGNVIGSTFILNGSVVFKQVGSMFAATSMIDYRDPASMVGNLIYTMANYDKIAAEVDKYTAAVWMRRQGLSDAEMHTLKTEAQKSKLGRFASKLPAVVNPSKWISAMDSSVALSLWKYAKQDVAKRTGLSGEELNRATAEHYEDVIEYTQSMTDALHRPEIQKSDNIASELFGMFKTDLYQGAGQLRVAAGQWAADKSSANSKKLAKTIASSLSSICWGALMTSVWALIRYKVNPYRDEEDELTPESWLKIAGADVASEMIGYVVPLFGGEVAGSIFSIANGGSAEDLDSVSLTAVNELIDAIEKATKYIKDGEMPSAKVYTNILAKFASVFGVPANNVIRLIDAIKLHAEDIANNEFLSFEAGLTSPNALRLYNAYIEGDADKIKKASRLYKDQKDIDSALRKQLRENDPRMKEAANAYIAGDYAKYNALRAEIVSEGIFSNTLVTDALKAEINYIKNKDKESE